MTVYNWIEILEFFALVAVIVTVSFIIDRIKKQEREKVYREFEEMGIDRWGKKLEPGEVPPSVWLNEGKKKRKNQVVVTPEATYICGKVPIVQDSEHERPDIFDLQ